MSDLIPKDRVIQILNGFADGTYQAILPEVCGRAARLLARSKPEPESFLTIDAEIDRIIDRIIAMTDAECLAAGIAEYGSEEAWRAEMALLKERMLLVVNGKAPAKEGERSELSSSREELLPCPFCEPLKAALQGGGPTLAGFGEVRTPGENWHGLCPACGAEGPKEADPVAARAAWNRRSTPAGRGEGEMAPPKTASHPSPTSSAWRTMDDAPKEEDGVPFLVRLPKNSVADFIAMQVTIFEGRMYPDHLDGNIDYQDGIENATGWMPLPPKGKP